MKRKDGFSAIEGIIVLGVLVLVVGVGYFGLKALTKSSASNSETSSSVNSSTSSNNAEVITSKADLEAAEKELDSLSFDDQSDSESESQANL